MAVNSDRADTLPTSISAIAAVGGGPAGLGVEADVGLAVHDEGEDAVAAAVEGSGSAEVGFGVFIYILSSEPFRFEHQANP